MAVKTAKKSATRPKKSEPQKQVPEGVIIVEKGATQQIRIELRDGRGNRKFVDVRNWFLDDGDVWRPTSKGLWIPCDDSIPEEVAAAILSLADPDREKEVKPKKAKK